MAYTGDKFTICMSDLHGKFVLTAGVTDILRKAAKEIFLLNEKIDNNTNHLDMETFITTTVDDWMKKL